ncbi:MAG: Lrp/AsnC family transcriptional regulator, partial [Geminicoccaceae bacterium]
MSLDEFDRKILTALQRDGRASVEKIAEIVGLSPTPTRRRIRRLEQEGAIKGYVAVVDPKACGLDLTLYVFIKLERRSRENIDGFEKAIERLPEVVSCDLVTGPHD